MAAHPTLGVNHVGRLLPALLLASGLAGIAYEILYGRILGNILGDQFAVSASILITFLFGIGTGALHAWRLARWLWAIELAIGLYGAAFALAAPWLDAWLYALPGSAHPLAMRIAIACALLAIPAFLIGCSVPLFSAYLERTQPHGTFHRVYAVYNLGAAATALLIEFGLLRALGIRQTVLCFALLNIALALLLRRFIPPVQTDRIRLHLPAWDQWLWLIPVSIASAVFQLFMLKLAEMLLGPFRETFALVLSIVLLGIALGAMLARRLRLKASHVLLLALAGLLPLLAGLPSISERYASLYPHAAESVLWMPTLKWLLLFVLMGLPSIAFGATIPALMRQPAPHIAHTSGQWLFIASMANVAGFLIMVFVLHRWLDYGVMLLVIAAFILCAMLLLRASLLHKVAAGLLLVLAIVAWHTRWDESLLYISYRQFHDPDALRQARQALGARQTFKGYQDVFSINEIHGRPYFFINGYTSIPLDNPSEKIVGILSSWFAPRLEQALVLGLGSGATAAAVGSLFAHTDVVEINPVVRDNLDRMKQWNFDLAHNPRVSIVVDDAIHYVRAIDTRYDVILNTVTTPLYFSSSKLYTREFFARVKQRLRPDGIYVTWMDGRVGDRGADIILHTIRGAFRHCALFYIKSSYFLLICSDVPLSRQRMPAFRAGHIVYDDLLRRHGIIPEWLPYQLLTSEITPLIGRHDTPINTLDKPALEFEMARLGRRGIHAFKQRLLQALDLTDIRHALHDDERTLPAMAAWHAELRLGQAALTRQWRALAKERLSDFESILHQLQRDYYRRLKQVDASAAAFHHFGLLMARKGYDLDAVRLYRDALARDPQHRYTHFNLASSLERLGRLDEALRQYQQEQTLAPNDGDVPFRIGRILVKLGRPAQAIPYLQQALTMLPEREHRRIRRWLKRAQASE